MIKVFNRDALNKIGETPGGKDRIFQGPGQGIKNCLVCKMF